ncbi:MULTISPECIES: hypothetical protein [Chryseobacterium]|nr:MULTISPECIES: hypothetical protein [Chryseobacterium]
MSIPTNTPALIAVVTPQHGMALLRKPGREEYERIAGNSSPEHE